jgi:CRISPR-associated protein Cmr1
MRKPPDPPPSLPAPGGVAQIIQARRYALITPLFGGGVAPSRQDPITPVRGTAIRGHLRFWWRATRAGHYVTVAALREAEGRLWGAASTNDAPRPSQVQIAVSEVAPGHDFVVPDNRGRPLTDNRGDPIGVGHFRSPFSYVAFPLQQARGTVRDGVAFTLHVTAPAAWSAADAPHFAGGPQDEIAAALWAWETFGGIGARTRRGFGALRCLLVDGQKPDLPAAAGLERWLAEQLARHVVTGDGPAGLPRLSHELRWYRLVPERQSPTSFWADPVDAWRQLFTRLKDFRQPRPPGSDDPRRPGRSRWPETEAIRSITRRRLPRHQPLPTSGKFPRAAFGLPIIFQFKDQGDPDQTSLQGVGDLDRLSSPLILRPLVAGDGKVAGLALVLDAPRVPPGGLTLRQRNAVIDTPNSTLTPTEASQIMDRDGRRPLFGSNPDVLEAFLNFL